MADQQGGVRPEVGAALSEIFSVEGLRTLVTGGGSGLGLAMAEVMVDCGANVTVLDVSEERLERVLKRLTGRAGQIDVVHADVADVEDVRRAVTGVVEAQGGLDVAFVNAGVGSGSKKVEGELDGLDDAWQRVININLIGAFATLQAVASPMRRQGRGRIIVTASTAGLRADPFVSNAYIAAKAAMVNLTRQAALELAPHGVHVNAIAPGPFHTNIGSAVDRPADEVRDDSRWNATIAIGRMGEPAELKGLALLLASPASSFITGAVIPIDGGALIKYAM